MARFDRRRKDIRRPTKHYMVLLELCIVGIFRCKAHVPHVCWTKNTEIGLQPDRTWKSHARDVLLKRGLSRTRAGYVADTAKADCTGTQKGPDALPMPPKHFLHQKQPCKNQAVRIRRESEHPMRMSSVLSRDRIPAKLLTDATDAVSKRSDAEGAFPATNVPRRI